MSPNRMNAVEPLEARRLLAAPEILEIKNQTIPASKSLHIPVATNSDGSDRVRYSVQSTGAVVTAEFRSGDNTWIEMDTELGSMTLQLFDDLAPDTVRRMLGLVKAGFFDGLTFHRTVPGFVIQGGDPNGDGTGGPEFSFSDEFDPKGLFTGDGTLAMANSGKDTNGSQFFITTNNRVLGRNQFGEVLENQNAPAGPPRFLDFNHTVWGQLVRGSEVFRQIISRPTDENGTPDEPVTINSVRIVKNRSDAVLVLTSTGKIPDNIPTNGDESGGVTITARTNGGVDTLTFRVKGARDNNEDPAILNPLPDRTMARNGTLSFKVAARDIDSAPTALSFAAELVDTSLGTVTTTGDTITFVPKENYVGPVDILVGARSGDSRGSSNNPFDTQVVRIGVGDRPADGVGAANLAATVGSPANLTVARFTDADPNGVATQWSASIDWGDGDVTDGTVVRNADGSFSVQGTHTYARIAEDMPLTVTITGNRGAREIVNGSVDVGDIATLSRTNTLLVNGSSGNDTIVISRLAGGNVRVNVNGVVRNFDPTVRAIKRLNVFGFEGNDSISNSLGVPSTLEGGAGNDTLSGGAAGDTLFGGAGKDDLFGGASDDFLVGGAGTDVLDGEAGFDSAAASSTDSFANIEQLLD